MDTAALSSPPRTSDVWKTPVYQQFWREKDQVNDAILFFKLGDFYEIFGDDAIKAAPILGVQLTSKNKGHPTPVPMCGVPVHSLEGYSQKILLAGYKIAICDQVGEVIPNKLVERKVTRILTPGFSYQEKTLDKSNPHWLLTVFSDDQEKFDVLLYDFLRNDYYQQVGFTEEQLTDLFLRFDVKELLVNESISNLKLFSKYSNHITITPWLGDSAVEILTKYFCFTQRCAEQDCKKLLPQAKPLSLICNSDNNDFAYLPAIVLQQWAVFPELYELLNKCGSAIGSRRLRNWLSKPLAKKSLIQTRQDFLKNLVCSEDILKLCRKVYDLERLMGKFKYSLYKPRDFIRFKNSFLAINELIKILIANNNLSSCSQEFKACGFENFEASLKEFEHTYSKIKNLFKGEIDWNRVKDSFQLIEPMSNPEFLKLWQVQENSQQWLENYQQKLREQYSIPTLKVRRNKVVGFFIEVTKAQSKKIPEDVFTKKQTMVNVERFVSEELTSMESSVLSSHSKLSKLTEKIFADLAIDILNDEQPIRNIINVVSHLDAGASIVESAKSQSRFGVWNYPVIHDGEFKFSITEGRHPVMESMIGSDFVANDIALGMGDFTNKNFLLLTGPNMAGKSTIMRQTGLLILLAQCGFPVPVAKMSLCPADGFYSRMGASDNILAGDSTFMVEMKECAQILLKATVNSFVLVDEVGRGTSTQDGLAIAKAVFEELVNINKCKTIFATHFHELCEFGEDMDLVQNSSMAIREYQGELIFLRQLIYEPAKNSYGLFVAKLAGIRFSVIELAKRYLKQQLKQTKKNSQLTPQQDLFDFDYNLKNENSEEVVIPSNEFADLESVKIITEVDLNDLSPKQAWELLEEFKNELGS